MDPGIGAAVIAGAVALGVSGISALATWAKLSSDYKLQAEKLRSDAQLQEARLRTELKTEFMAEDAINQLLSHPAWDLRSFEQIKRKLLGFEDNALRRLLVRSGAVAFYTGSDEELWGLRTRNADKLQ